MKDLKTWLAVVVFACCALVSFGSAEGNQDAQRKESQAAEREISPEEARLSARFRDKVIAYENEILDPIVNDRRTKEPTPWEVEEGRKLKQSNQPPFRLVQYSKSIGGGHALDIWDWNADGRLVMLTHDFGAPNNGMLFMADAVRRNEVPMELEPANFLSPSLFCDAK